MLRSPSAARLLEEPVEVVLATLRNEVESHGARVPRTFSSLSERARLVVL